MPNFHVCQVCPPDYVHAHALDEVAQMIAVNADCSFGINEMRTDKINIIIGWHILGTVPPGRYVVYQLEQLSDREGWEMTPSRMAVLHGADAVWDFAPANIAWLADKGIKADLLVPGHHPFNFVPPGHCYVEKTTDVLFYGSMNGRREKIITALAERCNVKTLFGVYGQERDIEIARAKVVLCMHFYEAQLLETVRLSHLISNKAYTIAETSTYNPYEGFVEVVDFDCLVGACLHAVEAHQELPRLADLASKELSKRWQMVSQLAPLLAAHRAT